MVLCRRTSQLGGSPLRPGHRSSLRAWGRSGVLGRVGGAGPTVGAVIVALALLAVIARLVFRAGGIRWLLAFIFAAIYGAALAPLVLAL